jgi:hypothetical protein
VGTLALSAGFAAGAPAALAHPGEAVPLSVFPSDDLTVPDPGRLTGRRIALPTTGCGAPVSCGQLDQLDQLDGFDLDPRIAVQFSAPVDPAEAAARISVQEAHGGWRTGVDRVVWDPATNTLYAHPAEQLADGARSSTPDGAGAVWEVPISDPAVLLPLNFAQPALRP